MSHDKENKKEIKCDGCKLCTPPSEVSTEDWEHRFRQIGEGSVRFIATREEVRDFIRTVREEAKRGVIEKIVEKVDNIDFGLVTRGKAQVIDSVKNKVKKIIKSI